MKNKDVIVLDFEFNPVLNPELKPAICNEIIEIGAVRLDSNYNVCDSFNTYIRPLHNEITPIITSITSITNDTVADSPVFTDAMKKFAEWAGDSPRFYAWSSTDRDVLIREMDFKLEADSPLYDVFECHWVDLQKLFGRIMGFKKSMGLSNALGVLEVTFNGTEHGALADAENTARIMKILCDKPTVKKLKARTAVTYNQSTASAGFTMGNLFAEQFAKLSLNDEE
ncbi:MAG: exonuclease domain-containing protein [Oscillospiraceae bacterium]|nr:exonuclease domain-containing protein [Oscillospiraceae bacterium]